MTLHKPTRHGAGVRTVAGLCGLLLCWSVSAADTKLTLEFKDVLLTPGTAVRLKAKLLAQQPDFSFTGVTLRAVTVEAKSREGRGRVALRVGGSYSESERVGGSIEDFAATDRDSYYRVELLSASSAGDGVWQLLIAGYVRLRSVTLHLSSPAPAPI